MCATPGFRLIVVFLKLVSLIKNMILFVCLFVLGDRVSLCSRTHSVDQQLASNSRTLPVRWFYN